MTEERAVSEDPEDRPAQGGVLGGSTPQTDERPADDVPRDRDLSTTGDPAASGAVDPEGGEGHARSGGEADPLPGQGREQRPS